MPREPSRYEFVDAVTSDLVFRARGATPEALFCAAAEALLAATLEEPASVEARVERYVALEARDLELLLLRFLNELVFLRDAQELLLRPARLRIDAGAPARLEAWLAGEQIDRLRHRLASDVKAATAHGLRVVRTPEGLEAQVTLDV